MNLRSEQGTSIELTLESRYEDRSSNKPLYVTELSRVSVTLLTESKESEQARMVFVNTVHNKSLCGNSAFEDVFQYELDLERAAPGVFQAELIESGKVLWGIGDQRKMVPISFQLPVLSYVAPAACKEQESRSQHAAFVIDGVWQKNSMSQSSNFSLFVPRP